MESWFSWGTCSRVALCPLGGGAVKGWRDSALSAFCSPSFVCKILIRAGRAAMPPGQDCQARESQWNCRGSTRERRRWQRQGCACPPTALRAACRGAGRLPGKGEDMREKEGAGGESKGERLCSPGRCAAGKVATTVPGSFSPSSVSRARGCGRGWRRGHAERPPAEPERVGEEQGREGQQGSGSASACSASRLPPHSPSPQPFPSSPLCVWQLKTEARGSGWRTARTPGSLTCCWLFLRLAAGRAWFQS